MSLSSIGHLHPLLLLAHLESHILSSFSISLLHILIFSVNILSISVLLHRVDREEPSLKFFTTMSFQVVLTDRLSLLCPDSAPKMAKKVTRFQLEEALVSKEQVHCFRLRSRLRIDAYRWVLGVCCLMLVQGLLIIIDALACLTR